MRTQQQGQGIEALRRTHASCCVTGPHSPAVLPTSRGPTGKASLSARSSVASSFCTQFHEWFGRCPSLRSAAKPLLRNPDSSLPFLLIMASNILSSSSSLKERGGDRSVIQPREQLLQCLKRIFCGAESGKPTLPLAPSPRHSSPLPVLVQAVDDGVPLLDDGHQLLHQHLLPHPVLLGPVLLCRAKARGRTGNYTAEGAQKFGARGRDPRGEAPREKRRQREPGRCFTWLVEEAAQLVLHVRLPLLQVLLLEAAREGGTAGTRCGAPEKQSVIPKLGATSGRTQPSPDCSRPFWKRCCGDFGDLQRVGLEYFWTLLSARPLSPTSPGPPVLAALRQDSPQHRRCPLPRTHTRLHVDELRLVAHQHVLLVDELEPLHQQAVLGAVCQAKGQFRASPSPAGSRQRSARVSLTPSPS